MEIKELLSGMQATANVLFETFSLLVNFLWNEVMSLEAAADVATIIAAVIASGAIINWVRNLYYKKSPFLLKRAVYSRLVREDRPAYFRITVENRYTQEIVVRYSQFFGIKRYSLRESGGRVTYSELIRPLGIRRSSAEDPIVIAPGAEQTFVFKYDLASDAEPVYQNAKNLNLRTNRGEYFVKIPSFDLWEVRSGFIGYEDEATSLLGKYKNQIRYWWWKHCLSTETQREFIRRR